MDRKNIITQTEQFVKEKLAGDSSGHDWWHIYRVKKLAAKIGEIEKADLFIIEMAALLHDIADHKFHNGNHKLGPKIVYDWCTKLQLEEKICLHISEIVAQVSFKGGNVETPMNTLEGKVVQDADRLDAIGAIGIARTFAYGGNKNHPMYDPAIKPEMHDSFDNYKKSKGTTINHFYEKLLLLKSRLNTNTAKKIAKERHTFMEEFLERFYKEWEGIS
ncbi:MAG: phosphohydrolase [Marinilabiliales bacterium]|nr:MAG: phosphohydrolase [Marinilabiliales bacterium]